MTKTTKRKIDAASPGLAPTAGIDPGRGAPSMFEPIRGAAFDIAGKSLSGGY